MKSDKKICIYGAGGFGAEVLCCIIDTLGISPDEAGKYACFMTDDAFFNEQELMGIEVIRRSSFLPDVYSVLIAVGDPAARKKIVASMPPETDYASLIHPRALVSKWVELGEGSIVTAGSILTCNISIGKHAHLNLNTTIGHDCRIGDFFTTAPGANISGKCTFGEAVYVGTNAAVKQGIGICDHVTIGMGGVVVKDIKEPGVYIGNPLKKLEK